MRRAWILMVLVAALGPAATASASSVRQVITDCNTHGQLTGHYTVAQLRQALATLPADVKEYTDCYDVIQRALLGQVGGASHGGGPPSSSGSGGSFLPTPLIVLLALVAVGGAGFGVAAARRRSGEHTPGS